MKTKKNGGLTLVEFFILAVIGCILASFSVYSFDKAREMDRLHRIVNNLRVIEGAKDLWMMSLKKKTGDTPSPKDIAPYMRNGVFPPVAVVGEKYQINPVGTPAIARAPVKLGTYKPNSAVTVLAQ